MFNGIKNAIGGIMEKIVTIVDIIPKVVYFLFAALTSGVDALQALVRKLAGLDSYYQTEVSSGFNGVGAKVSGKDPLTEFIYGILGIGDSAPLYKGLNTVFWSLAIFGLIVLVISTIAAIIKSHYNEDTEGTSPWKYIYTAIKAILTFAIMPVIVVVGMQLASFVLKTLDNITTGSANEEKIKSVYGTDATNIFKGETINGQDYKSYAHYDMFGAGSPTNSITFGGMLFNAAINSANRARTGDVDISDYQSLKSNSSQIFGNSNCAAFNSLQTEDEKAEYVAYQIDYAFSNCLELQTGISYSSMTSAIDVRYWKTTDLFRHNTVKSFSKYNVSAVWLFYDLWKFNFIVGFAGAISTVGIMLSIIIGMMSRLIKGAALFLVYPAILGIAPLDNFKAFKNWGTSFMQQIMMAFGSIVGFNLLLLILPYIQNISFFGIGVVDYIVNVIILIAGLMMAKDFISMVSGFVGGADAVSSGEGMKGGIGGGFKRGFGVAGKAGATVGKVGYHVGKATGKTVGKAATTITRAAVINPIKAQKAKNAAKRANMTKDEKAANKKWAKANEMFNKKNATDKDAINQAGAKAYNKAIRKGKSKEEAEKAKEIARNTEIAKQNGSGGLKGIIKRHNARKVLSKYDKDKLTEKYGLAKGYNGKMISTYNQWTGAVKKDKKTGELLRDANGKYIRSGGIGPGIGKTALAPIKGLSDIVKTMADGILKAVQDGIGKGVGLDKMFDGAKEIFGDMRHTRWVKDPFVGEPKKKLEGDKLQSDIAGKQEKKADDQISILKDIKASMKDMSHATKANSEAIKGLGTTFKAANDNNNNTPTTI